MKIPDQYKSLEYIHDMDWDEIFSIWRSYEAYQKSWEEHWRERGFSSWDDWRKNYISPIDPGNKYWKIYRIKNVNDILNFYGVPSRGWIEKCYNGEITKRLSEIEEHPIVRNNNKIDVIKNNFPYQTMLTGVINKNKIVLVEGMHRAMALTGMAKSGLKNNGDVVIALAEYEGELPRLGKGDSTKYK